MERQHLTDDDLQNFLEVKDSPGRREVQDHLKACARCRKALEGYRRLSEMLGRDPGYRLPSHFITRVMESLPAKGKVTGLFSTLEWILISAGATAGVVIAFVLTDLKKITGIFKILAENSRTIKEATGSTFQTATNLLNGNLPLLGMALLALLFTYGLDRFLIQKHGKATS
jgi:hypothetical protein